MEKINIEAARHSLSHVMAMAVIELYPEAKLAIGPAIDNGFYYDFDKNGGFIPDDLAKIEERMREIIGRNLKLVREELDKKSAEELFRKSGEGYKVELLSEIPDEKVSIYRQGTFVDLCRGPHMPST